MRNHRGTAGSPRLPLAQVKGKDSILIIWTINWNSVWGTPLVAAEGSQEWPPDPWQKSTPLPGTQFLSRPVVSARLQLRDVP